LSGLVRRGAGEAEMLAVCVIKGGFAAVRAAIQANGMLSYAVELQPSIVQIVYAVTWWLHPVAPQ